MKKRISQREIVLRLLQNQPEGITALDALRWGAGLRLAARISDLRAEGYVIESRLVSLPSGSRVARYRLAA